MFTMKQPFEEAKSKLGDKIVDIKSKTLYLHKLIDDISLVPISHAENILKEVTKKEFFSKYIKVSQELEGCLGRLLLILDVVSSSGEESVTHKTVHVTNSGENIQKYGNNQIVQIVPLTSPERNSDNMKNESFNSNETVANNVSYRVDNNVDGGPHFKKFKKSSPQEKSTDRVTCHLCGKTVRGNYELKVHLACRHTSESKSELKYVCMLCPTDPKRYARGDRLKEHIERIHLNISNKHVCSFCGRGFNRPGRRNKHQLHCKGIDQDVEVIITEDNVLLSSNIDAIKQGTGNEEEEVGSKDDDVENRTIESDKDDLKFYTETVDVDVKKEVTPCHESSEEGDESDSNSVNNDSDTLHISDKDNMNISSDNEASEGVETAKSDSSSSDSALNSREGEKPVHIISDRNSMVM